MADGYVHLLQVPRSTEEQMIIYATLRRYKQLSERERDYIRWICAEIGGPEYGKALFRYLTTDIGLQAAVQRFQIPEGKLRKMRREVYAKWEL